MKKLFGEFKKFITKGNAMDLAVGMIIGAAFTAIVTALVNSILKPLINWIPISDTTGLVTVLRPAVIDPETNAVLTEALVLDWGAVISAIITFLLTALVLFIIVKAINTAREGGDGLKKKMKAKTKKGQAEIEAAAQAQAEADAQAQAAELAAQAEAAKVEAARANQQKTVELLEQILEMLKNK